VTGRATAFFRSRLYAGFWLFTLQGAAAVGMFSAVGIAATGLYAGSGFGPWLAVGYVWLVAAAYALIPAALGFWLVVALSRRLGARAFSWVAAGVGTAMAVGLLGWVFQRGLSLSPDVPLVLFPVGPALASIAVFVRLARKYARPD
jgi:hypothetical protein